jgi:hypothetical protein
MKNNLEIRYKFIAAFCMAFLFAGMTAGRVGYMITEDSIVIRWFMLFPALLFAWFAYIFFFKWGRQWDAKGHCLTIHQVNLGSVSSFYDGVKLIFAYVVGFPLMAAIFAWFSIGVPAWAALALSQKPYSHEYIYVPSSGWSKRALYFVDAATQQKILLSLAPKTAKIFPEEVRRAYANKIICLKGRTSFFGTIVERIDAGSCRTTGSRPRLVKGAESKK